MSLAITLEPRRGQVSVTHNDGRYASSARLQTLTRQAPRQVQEQQESKLSFLSIVAASTLRQLGILLSGEVEEAASDPPLEDAALELFAGLGRGVGAVEDFANPVERIERGAFDPDRGA